MPTTRRQLIQLAALPALLNAQDAPKFFAPADFETLQAYTEILIPTDDTPGAREARCAHYIDFVLQSTDNATPWREAMLALKSLGFHAADQAGREAIVAAMSAPAHPNHAVFQLIKRETAFAFYTSRTGTLDALDYRGNSFNHTFPACDHPEHHAEIL
jgi:hypothetical protein